MAADRAKTILIVEDQKQIRQLIALTLRPLGTRFCEATNAADALALAFSQRPAVVVLDVHLDGPTDGYEVCRRLRAAEELRSSRIVIVTTRSHPKDVATIESVGADAYLLKPFSPELLLSTVQRLLS